MSGSKKNSNASRETFLKKYDNINLRNDLATVEKRVPGFWDVLEDIREHYRQSLHIYKSALGNIIDEISNEDMSHPVIHSIRYRAKDVDSLIVKLIQKSAQVPMDPQGNPDIEKYRIINKDNYYKLITDLIGVRILIRYRHQWKDVHSLIWKLFHSDEYEYIENWVDEYKNDPAVKYIVEKPKAYVKQSTDRPIYEEIGKNIFDIKDSNNHYASLHYIVNVGGRYCEIQVRTIFDEAWCECDHDFVYKAATKSKKDKKTLEKLSIILSQHTTAAESIVNLMCELATPTPAKKNAKAQEVRSHTDSQDKLSKSFSAIQKRAEQLSETESFIDSLIHID